MRPSRVRQRWNAGQPAFCTSLRLDDPVVCELVSRMGFDCIWIDLEHVSLSVKDLTRMGAHARLGGADVIARPARWEYMRMSRMLEAGAHGIMYPRCESVDEAREVVRWCKFAPLGERGFDGGNADSDFIALPAKDYTRRANEETFLLIQIESPAAVACASEIARVPGVDMLFFGPGDFSVLSGIPGEVEDARVRDAMRQTAAAARDAGKRFGTLTFSEEQAQFALELGASFISFGCDLYLLKAAYEDIQRRFAPLGFRFDSPGDEP